MTSSGATFSEIVLIALILIGKFALGRIFIIYLQIYIWQSIFFLQQLNFLLYIEMKI